MTFTQDLINDLAPMMYNELGLPTTNLVDNLYTVDTVGLTAYNCTLEIVSSESFDGGTSLAIRQIGTAGCWPNQNLRNGNWFPVQAGNTYTYSIYLKQNTGGTRFASAIFDWSNLPTYWGGSFTQPRGPWVSLPSGKWTKLSITAVAPAGATYAILYPVFTDGGWNSGDTVYADLPRFEQSSSAYTPGPLTAYLGGLGLEFEKIESWVSDTDTDVGWSLLLDIDKCPNEALPWLAQIVGLTLPNGLTATDQRNLIKTTPNWKRGTIGALKGAAAPFLTGNKTVILRERYDGSVNDAPYYLQVITYQAETPVEDWPTTNLVRNGGFEVNANDWYYDGDYPGGTVARSTAWSKFGTASLRTQIPAGAGTYGGCHMGTTPFPVTPGTQIVVSFYAHFFNAIANFTTRLVFLNSVGAIATNGYDYLTQGSFAAGSEARIIHLPKITPVDAVSCDLLFYATSPPMDFAIDGVQAEVYSVPTPYVDTNGATASRAAGGGLVGKALRSQKAGGIIMTYTVAGGQDYQTLKNNNATYQIVKNKYPTYAGMKSDTGV